MSKTILFTRSVSKKGLLNLQETHKNIPLTKLKFKPQFQISGNTILKPCRKSIQSVERTVLENLLFKN